MSEVHRSSKRLRVHPETAQRTRKSERTLAAILDGALEFLWDAPFRDLSVSALMARVGASRPVFYQYFSDLHGLMEDLLRGLAGELERATSPWFTHEDDPVQTLRQSLAAMVLVGYAHGPFVQAVADAASTDGHLHRAWTSFLGGFDDAVEARIEEQQAKGWIAALDARMTAVALNRLNLSMILYSFGRRPRKDPGPVRDTVVHVWSSTLYPDTTLET